MSRSANRWRAGAALLILHLYVCWPFQWEEGNFAATWLRPSPDLVAVLAVAIAARLARPMGGWLLHAATVALLFVPVYRFGYTVLPVYFGKEFEPWPDVLMLRGLEHLVTYDRWSRLAVAGALAVAGLGVLVVYALVHRLVACVLRAADTPRGAGAFLLAAQAMLVVGAIETSATGAPCRVVLRPSMLRAMAGAAADAVTGGGWRHRELFAERAAAATAELAATPQDLGKLGGADVYVVFLESYGRAAWRGRAGQELAAGMPALQSRLEQRGFAAASGFAAPSVRGGLSSLSHCELLCGLQVEDRRAFHLLLGGSGVTALPKLFAAKGYHTVNVQPAMTQEWPDSRHFFGFARDAFRPHLPYSGRQYQMGTMPDQVALDHALRHVIWPASQPIFLQFVSATCHAPFSMVPAYFEDWDRLADPATFAGEPLRRYDIGLGNYARHPDVEAAYLDCVRYSLRCAVGFAERLRRPSLLLVLGDHQPPLAGLASTDPTRDVPVHVLSDRADLVESFVEQGFAPGLEPSSDAVAVPMWKLRGRFLRAMSGR